MICVSKAKVISVSELLYQKQTKPKTWIKKILFDAQLFKNKAISEVWSKHFTLLMYYSQRLYTCLYMEIPKFYYYLQTNLNTSRIKNKRSSLAYFKHLALQRLDVLNLRETT